MTKGKIVSVEQVIEIRALRKANKDKRVDKRLHAVQLRGEGFSNADIAVILEVHPKVVSRWICAYLSKGEKALKVGHYGGNRRNMTFEEERKFLAQFDKKAENGEVVTAKEIMEAYIKKIGHTCGKGQIYLVFKRQNWRKVVPRKEHPKKANEVEKETSKKLTFE